MNLGLSDFPNPYLSQSRTLAEYVAFTCNSVWNEKLRTMFPADLGTLKMGASVTKTPASVRDTINWDSWHFSTEAADFMIPPLLRGQRGRSAFRTNQGQSQDSGGQMLSRRSLSGEHPFSLDGLQGCRQPVTAPSKGGFHPLLPCLWERCGAGAGSRRLRGPQVWDDLTVASTATDGVCGCQMCCGDLSPLPVI